MDSDTLILISIVSGIVYFAILYFLIKHAVDAEKRHNQTVAIIKLLSLMAMQQGVSNDKLLKIIGSKLFDSLYEENKKS